MNEPLPNPFDNRVSEARVAAVLTCIAEPPNRREQPQPGDAPGDCDFWFDGGACKHHTGSTNYQFTDGTVAVVASPAAWLWVRIAFADGQSVEIQQHKPV